MKKRLLFFLIISLIFISAVAAITVTAKPSIPKSVSGKLEVYTRNKPDAEITVAVIDGNNTSISAYGKRGKAIEVPQINYEIGGITKTFTGAMAAETVLFEQMRLQDKLIDHMVLNPGTYAPSIYELLTHTSAYGSYPGYSKSKYNSGKNPYSGYDYPKMISIMDDFRLNQTPPYLYSNSEFGSAIVGMILEDIYGEEFYNLLSSFVADLGLENTYVALDKKSAPKNGWVWKENDSYMASLGLTSNIDDMVSYARLYIDQQNNSLNLTCMPLVEINMEKNVAFFWNVDQNGAIEHEGETSHYSSYIMIDRQSQRAVIILSNYASDRYGSVKDIAKAIYSESFE